MLLIHFLAGSGSVWKLLYVKTAFFFFLSERNNKNPHLEWKHLFILHPKFVGRKKNQEDNDITYISLTWELLCKYQKSAFLWMQESSWNNLISISHDIFNGFQDELVVMCSFFTYKFWFEPSRILCPIKSRISAKLKARGTVGKVSMQMNQTTKPGGLNVCYSYTLLEAIIVISFLKNCLF